MFYCNFSNTSLRLQLCLSHRPAIRPHHDQLELITAFYTVQGPYQYLNIYFLLSTSVFETKIDADYKFAVFPTFRLGRPVQSFQACISS